MINIYYLEKDNIPFYVGKTKDSLNKRIHNHKKKFGSDITIKLISIVDETQWKFWESYWIKQFQQQGFKLENKNKGGGGLPYHSQETKDKIKYKNLGRKKPLTSKLLKNRKYSQDTINKMSKSHFGKPRPTSYVPVNQYDLQGNFIKEWKSMTEVAEYYKVTLGSINNAVYGHSKSSCGFKWKIKE